MSLELNVYSNVTNPNVLSATTTQDWFALIKESVYSAKILAARNGKANYDAVKKSIPCVTFNYIFNEYKKDANIISPTGCMYIDIDNPEFDISTLDLSKVYAYYHSFGGKGYAVIVKVDGLTKDNFKSSYLSICHELGISQYIDTNAIKASQFNVLSYDRDIYTNYDAYTFKAIHTTAPTSSIHSNTNSALTSSIHSNTNSALTSSIHSNTNSALTSSIHSNTNSALTSSIHSNTNSALTSSIHRERTEHVSTMLGRYDYEPIKFDDLHKVEMDGDYLVDWQGIENTVCFIPNIKYKQVPQNNLMAYAANLIYTNDGNITKEGVFGLMQTYCKLVSDDPVSDGRLMRIIESLFKQWQEGVMQHKPNPKKRKIVFNKKTKLSGEEKRDIVIREMAKKKTSDAKQKIYNIIENWDFEVYGQISQRKIYNSHPVSKPTVEKYYKEFKEMITHMNNTNAANLSPAIAPAIQTPAAEDKGAASTPNQSIAPVMTVVDIQAFEAMVLTFVGSLLTKHKIPHTSQYADKVFNWYVDQLIDQKINPDTWNEEKTVSILERKFSAYAVA